jgi:hypothetical protein
VTCDELIPFPAACAARGDRSGVVGESDGLGRIFWEKHTRYHSVSGCTLVALGRSVGWDFRRPPLGCLSAPTRHRNSKKPQDPRDGLFSKRRAEHHVGGSQHSQVHCSKLTEAELPRRVQVLDGRSEVTQLRAADSDPGAAEPSGGRHVERLDPMSSSLCATPPATSGAPVVVILAKHKPTMPRPQAPKLSPSSVRDAAVHVGSFGR